MNVLISTVYWGAIISVGVYLLCDYFQKKMKWVWLNPLLFSTVFTILFLVAVKVDYDEYYSTVTILNYLLTPATVCLAVPLYRQMALLKKHGAAILVGIFSGALASVTSILLFSMLFGFSHEMYVTLLPKSVTAAIAMGISEELGGISNFTVPVVIMTGITGNLLAGLICKLFRITEPIARGVGIGSASHAMGTAKAMEMGEAEGAMSSLSIAVSGLFTVILAPIFAQLW